MSTIRKAVLACAIATLGALATALGDGAVSAQEGVTSALAGLIALGGVYGVPNASALKPPPVDHGW